MKCQSWVDPPKFSKKTGRPTPRALIACYGVDWDYALSMQRTPQWRKRLAAQIERAVRCGGRVEFVMYADCDDEGGEIYAEIRCHDCGEIIHAIGMNSETVENWIQAQLDGLE